MRIHAILFLSALTLAACGGGGGSGAPGGGGGTVAISAANAQPVAAAAYEANEGIVDVTDFGSGVLTATTPGAAVPAEFDMTRFVRTQIERALSVRPDVRAAITTTTTACGSGTVTITFDDADNNGDLSTGDTFSITYVNCDEDDVTVNGTISLTNLVLSGDPSSSQFSVSITMNFENLTVTDGTETITFNGSITSSLTINNSTLTFSFTFNATFVTGTGTILAGTSITVTANSATNEYSYTSSGSVDVPSLSGSLSFQTITPFTANESDDYPNSGQLLVRGSNGSQLRLTALSSTMVQIEVDADGDGTFETTITITWVEFDDDDD